MLGTHDHATALVQALAAKGFTARAEEVDWPAFADSPSGPLGWRIRVGSFADQASAAGALVGVNGGFFVIDPADGIPGDGVEAVLDAHGTVTALRPRGGTIPTDGHVLQGIGTGTAWLAVAVNGKLVTSPSDATGERAIGDALLVPPR